MEEEAFDEEQRELCSDGACTGVIGPDGKCKECGKSISGEVSASPPGEPDFKAERGDHVFDDDDRALCPDGACIGLLNSQGICKVCGKAASS
jgi:hypothetical protein